MHEIGLVKMLLEQVETIAKAAHSRRVLGISVEVGLLAGVEPYLLQSAFQRELAESPIRQSAPDVDFSVAQLQIEEVPISAKCKQCGLEFEIPDFEFLCLGCRSAAIQVIRGDALRLMTVTFQEPEDAEVMS